MGSITSLSDLVNLQTNGSAQHYNTWVDNRVGAAVATANIIGQITSLWKYNKSTGANGANPPTVPGEAPSRTTTGALKHTNATSGKELWLVGIEAIGMATGSVIMYDRLSHSRGLVGNILTAQTVNSAALTRNTGGIGNQIWLEIYTAVGASTGSVQVSYTNHEGTSGKITPVVVLGNTGNREEARIIRMPLADGDLGVQSVQSVTLISTTGTAGDFGVTIAYPLVRGFIEGIACGCFRDLLSGTPSMVKIPDDACLALAWMASSVTAPRLDFTYHAIEK
jgi:hypothetical protein